MAIIPKSYLAILVSTPFLLGCGTEFWQRDDTRHAKITNVLLISIDTCRADHLSCYGHKVRTTPNIDQLASQGVLFTRVQSTNPITLPAHCSMLTGTIPPYHNVHLNLDRLHDAQNETLAEVLQDNGYQTGAVIGAFPLDARFGLDQGFDSYDAQFSNESRRGIMNQRDAQAVSRAAISWIDNVANRPFFLFLHYFDPHKPYAPPAPFLEAFADDRYSGEIAYTDYCIGQVIDKLKALGLRDTTLIILTSDHGESLGEHGEDTHAYFAYQSTIRVPLIIAAPGCTRGHKVDDVVSLIDIMPTVLNRLNLPVPSQVQGEDLGEYLGGRSAASQNRYLYSESWYPAKFGCSPLRGLVHGKWHYIWSTKPELYDLSQDPRETNNLFEQTPDVADLLQGRLRETLVKRARDDGETDSQETEQDTIARLQSLGYVGGRPDITTDGADVPLEDAKDYVGVYRQYMAAQQARANHKLDEAHAHCLDILAHRPDTIHARFLLGHISAEQGRQADAIKHYSDVLAIAAEANNAAALNYEIYQAYNNLAWILATTTDSTLHDGPRALEYAKRANVLSGGRTAEILDTLAVAQAAVGEFQRAVTTAEQALMICGQDTTLAAPIRKRLELFKQDLPFRQAPP